MDAPRALFLSVYGSKRPLSLPLLSLPLQTQFENGVHGDGGGVCHALFVVPQLSSRPTAGPRSREEGERGCKKKFAITLDRQKTFLARPMHFSHDLVLACFMSHVLCFALSYMMGPPPPVTAPLLCEFFIFSLLVTQVSIVSRCIFEACLCSIQCHLILSPFLPD